jgi:Zinc carboxypeptidase
VLCGLAACTAVRGFVATPTPAEDQGFARVTSSREMTDYLARLAQESALAQVVPIGQSALGVPMEALVLSQEQAALAATPPRPTRLTVLLVASQHGTEPSGGEALLGLARDVVDGPLASLLDDLNLVLIPNANPDGRDGPRRVNGNGINLSTNFTILSEPEARAVEEAIWRWRPEVLLDIHESAIFKGKTLARQGYLTDFEAQFEVANNPNVDRELAALTQDQLLPAVLAGVNEKGLLAHRYFGEITDVEQPITQGGLSLKNLRNKAGMLGMVSFLVENRLDPKGESYPTPRNLRGRIDKQTTSILSFLDVVRERRTDIASLVNAARGRALRSESPIYLVASYGPDPSQPEVQIRLRRADTGEVVERTFRYEGQIQQGLPLVPPSAYVVTRHQTSMRRLLDRHHIAYEVRGAPAEASLVVQRIVAGAPVSGRHGWGYTRYAVEERAETIPVPAGSLWIPLDQPAGRLVPLLLDPRSNSSVFQEPAYASLVEVGRDFFVARVAEGAPTAERVPTEPAEGVTPPR